jgi:hypothetical protein
MTATIKASKRTYPVSTVFIKPFGTYYCIELDGKRSRTVSNLRRIYPTSEATLNRIDTRCSKSIRKRTHASYKRTAIVRGRIAA